MADTRGVSDVAGFLAAQPRIALDTEADSLHHYHEKVCLIQIAAGGREFIVDPLGGADLTPLLRLFEQKPLLLHGADYDLRMLRLTYGITPTSIFDTMTAAKLLGQDAIGLAALVNRYCALDIPKHGQKADWSKRPLSQSLLDYAACDVRFLEDVAVTLENELREMGRLEWHREICKRIIETSANGEKESDPDREWRVKGWQTLRSKRELAILRALWTWREKEASRRDVPPFKILRNDLLVALAAWGHKCANVEEEPLPVPHKMGQKRLDSIRRAIRQARALSESELPGMQPQNRGRQPRYDEALLARLKTWRDETAAAHQLDPGVLLPNASLVGIARSRPKTLEEAKAAGELFDWQIQLLGDVLLAEVNQAPVQESA